MNKRINYAFLAFLAWMAALLCITILSSCGSSARYSSTYEGGVVKIHNASACAAYQ